MDYAALAALPPGTIVVISESFDNPKPDRRTRHDWRKAATIPEGKRFRIQQTRLDAGLVEMIRENGKTLTEDELVTGLVLKPVSGYTHQDIRLHKDGTGEPLALALIEKLQAVEARLCDVLSHAGCNGDAVLAMLLEQGVLTMAQVRATVSDVEALVDDDWHDFADKYGI